MQILNALERWEEAAIIGVGALKHHPQCGPLYLAAAWATRRHLNIDDAKVVLMSGEGVLKDNALYHFNLACYECQLGNLEEAKERLRRAFALAVVEFALKRTSSLPSFNHQYLAR